MHPLTSGDPDRIGPHRLLARLGAGGMGEVYLARTPQGRLSALKVVKEDLARDQEFRSRFAREVRTAQMVEGPFTPDVVDADPHADLPWMATEYVPGPTLTKAVKGNGPFPEASLRVLTIGLARALQAIHAAGLMHRDLKPDNVLLSPRGPQVIDFGIARAVEGTVLTKTGQAFGTPAYTSPEQVMGQETSTASDVFSLAGVVVYAATGRPPFGSGKAAEVLPRVVGQEPNLDGVPEPLRPLLARCLAKDPTERPTSDEIVRVLSADPLPSAEHGWLPAQVNQSINAHQHEAHQVVQASPSGPLQNTTTPLNQPPGSERGRRRTGLIAAGAGAAALLLAAGIGLAAAAPWENGEGDEGTAAPAPDSDGANEADGEADPEALGDQDDMAADWDGETGFDGFVSDVVFTPDGSGIYVRATSAMTLWNWESGEFRHRLNPTPTSFDLADDGTMVATYADTAVILDTDLETVELFDVAEELDDIIDYRAASISPDGSLVSVVVPHGDDQRTVYVWDREADAIVHALEQDNDIGHTEFSPDGDYLRLHILEGYPRVMLYDVATGEEVLSVIEEEPETSGDLSSNWHASAFSPTEPILAVDRNEGDIALYDYEEGEVVQEIEGGRSYSNLAFSADGQTLYSAGMGSTATGHSGGRAWDVATGEELTSGDTLLIDRLAVHPSGEALAAFQRDTLLLLDPETLEVINEIS
ncbi:WD40 repeat domain-containing serine/threonine protein kinase [Nocardiopsis valliformis]|uniref:WD40 repeat domain-containing serine/threonine protein kinase n=1 Tax=Nocardiopsis valliformis TaxID=239974 RepID=UPI00034C2D85|nr:serine/threonine-protein kinase [Nocardiopsis valliformis]